MPATQKEPVHDTRPMIGSSRQTNQKLIAVHYQAYTLSQKHTLELSPSVESKGTMSHNPGQNRLLVIAYLSDTVFPTHASSTGTYMLAAEYLCAMCDMPHALNGHTFGSVWT